MWYHSAAKKGKTNNANTVENRELKLLGERENHRERQTKKKKLKEGTFSPVVFEEREKTKVKTIGKPYCLKCETVRDDPPL